MTRPLTIASLSLAFLAAGCGGDDKPAPGGSAPENTVPKNPAAQSNLPKAGAATKIDMTLIQALFTAEPPAPKMRNRTTPAKVVLGRKLFHEAKLSHDGDISCASCHDLNNFGQDGKPTSPGTGGAAGKRNTPTVFNAYRQFAQFWDFRAETVEQQSTMPILTANEHGLKDEAEIVSILQGIPEYADLFKKAFAKDEAPITAANVQLALGAFERKLKTRSRWDDFVEGDEDALTDEEKRGLTAFIDVGCTTCHITRLLGGNQRQKLGLIRPIELADKGRFEFTEKAGDEYHFKVPSLLNVAKTAPYGHDGSKKTLEETVLYMVKHQVQKPASDSQVKAIVTFLGALTGELENPSVIAEK